MKKKLTKEQIAAEINNYLAAIIHFSHKMYVNSPIIDKEDLMQAGMVGLINGLNGYDKKKSNGAKKSSYIIRCIRSEMMDEANKFFGVFRLPHAKKLKLNKFYKQGMTKDKLIKELSLSNKEYNELYNLVCISTINESTSMIDIEKIIDSKDGDNFQKLLSELNLTEKERNLLSLRGAGYTFNEIGNILGLDTSVARNQFVLLVKKIRKDN